MNKFLLILMGVLVAIPTFASAIQVSVPSAPSAGYILVATSTGNYIATTTDPAHFGSIYGTSTATSTLNGGLVSRLLNITSTNATSTFANGISLSSGCYAIAGTCISGGGGGSSQWTTTGSDIYYSGGSVGIGTASPAAPLDVPVNNTTTNTAQFGTFGIQSYAVNNGFLQDNGYYIGSNEIYRQNGGIAMFQFGAPSAADISFRSAPSGTAGGVATLTTNMTVKGTGNVGIGTTNPQARLDVVSSTASNLIYAAFGRSSASDIMDLYSATDGTNYVRSGYGDLGFSTVAADLASNATEKMRITTAGNVGIGTTSPSSKLDIGGTVGYNTSRYNFNVADFVIQPYSNSNGFLANNAYYNGAAFTRINSGYASAFQFYNGQLMTFGANSGSGTFTAAVNFKSDFNGNVALGGNISTILGDYSGSVMTVLGTGNVGVGTTTPGSLFSIGTTNGINFSTATSTFNSTGGVNLTNGCFAIAGTCLGSGGGAVSSVSNADGTLTISPTTGAVVASLALGHVNTWTGKQTFSNAISIGGATSQIHAQVDVDNDTSFNFLGGSSGCTNGTGLKTGTDGTFLFDAGCSIKFKGGTGLTWGYTDGSFNYVFKSDSSGNTTQNGIITVNGTGTSTFVGSVGIASTTPWKKFSVTGTVAIDGLSPVTNKFAVCIDSVTKEIVNAGNNTCVTSSLKTKHDISDLSTTEALSDVLKLKPVSFTYNDGDDRRVGFVAEDVDKIDSRLVDYAATDTLFAKASGVIKKGEPIAVEYANISAILVKVVQEQQKQIDTIKGVARSAEENWQWIIIGLLAIGFIYQQTQINKLKK